MFDRIQEWIHLGLRYLKIYIRFFFVEGFLLQFQLKNYLLIWEGSGDVWNRQAEETGIQFMSPMWVLGASLFESFVSASQWMH